MLHAFAGGNETKPHACRGADVRLPGLARAVRPAAAALIAALTLAGMLASGAGATRPPGTRVTVALFGDSVTESVLVPDFLKKGLAPQLDRAVSALGYQPGGPGLIAATPFRWHFNKWAAVGGGPWPPDGWLAVGYGADSPGLDGPSGYSAVTTSPLATATVAVSDPDIEILYTTTSQPCSFTVTAAGQTWTINTYQAGTPTDTGTPLVLPAGRHELTVHGPNCGLLTFDGVVAQSPVPPGKVQIEVDNLGHSGLLPWVEFGPGVQESLVEQHYDISVFLWGYLGEVVGGNSLSAPYLKVMLARAQIAREHGGQCLIVAPTPIEVPHAAVTLVSRLDRTVARRGGCKYTTALTHLWTSPAVAERKGLLLVDGVHPTAAGYKVITHVLAPIIAGMVRTHLRR